jgi:hypothetical protein
MLRMRYRSALGAQLYSCYKLAELVSRHLVISKFLAPLATPHTICIETHSIEAYGITLFLGLNDPRASRVRVPHAPAVYPIGIHHAAYPAADG